SLFKLDQDKTLGKLGGVHGYIKLRQQIAEILSLTIHRLVVNQPIYLGWLS
ncbi:unnamed protein product, partial [marine sediment metagenome]